MRRPFHDAGPRKEASLLERHHERLGMFLRIHQVVARAGSEQYTDLVVVQGRVTDRRRIEIELAVFHWRSAKEFLDIVVETTLDLIGLPHRHQIVDAIDADQGLYLRGHRSKLILRITADEFLA